MTTEIQPCLVCGKRLFRTNERPFRNTAACTNCGSGYWFDGDVLRGYAPRERLGYLHFPEGCLLVLNWEAV